MTVYSRYTPDITVAACGSDWVLHRPANLEELWDSMADEDFGDDERLPYWVELWPASVALADWMQENREAISGKVCIGMGCGLGLTAMAASSFRARVIAMDYEPEALVYARRNAALNNVPQPLWSPWTGVSRQFCSDRRILSGAAILCTSVVLCIRSCGSSAMRSHPEAPSGWRNRTETYTGISGRRCSMTGGSAKPVYTGKLPAIYIQPERVSVTLWEITRS
jgi:hypothetical protein